jgi:TRAP-type C4-dicarboxylate transport system permease small subunit
MKRSGSQIALALFIALTLVLPAHAHIGSKDVYEEVNAGPYKLFVTIRTPNVIPGVATIEVRSSGAPVRSIQITPTPLTGDAAKHPPSSDAMRPSADDPAFFTGSLWLMAAGSWQVHFDLDGDAGKASTSVPVPAVPLSILPMQRPLGIGLAVLALILIIGLAGIVAAAVRESRLDPGLPSSATQRRRSLIASVFTLVFTALLFYGGYSWWNLEAAGYAADIYHPLSLSPMLSGNRLDLKIGRYDTDALHSLRARSNNDLLPDHGHVMHLYAIRQPGMDAVFHLHPALVSAGDLRMSLPSMPPGTYRLYADIVHANGFPETLSANLTIPSDLPSAPLASEDASAAPPALSQGELGTAYKLRDGYTMIWERPTELSANTAYAFRFRLLDTAGQPAADVRPYLGMAGHAAFVKTDGTVFAHTHPEGSAAMQAVILANGASTEMANSGSMGGMDMTGHLSSGGKDAEHIPPMVEFPYGFPSPGRYRIFIQMKHANTVETGVFDAEVR